MTSQESKYLGRTLVWVDPETGEEKSGTITEVGPDPYVWVDGDGCEGGGIPETYWVRVE